MTKKLAIRLSIVSIYFLLDLSYTFWKMKDQIITSTLIEKGLLFLGVSVSIYLITRKEERKNKITSPQ